MPQGTHTRHWATNVRKAFGSPGCTSRLPSGPRRRTKVASGHTSRYRLRSRERTAGQRGARVIVLKVVRKSLPTCGNQDAGVCLENSQDPGH